MEDKHPKVSVIFPTLNEANNIPLIFPYIPLDIVSEVIVVDGRSTDNTVEVAKEYLPSVKIVMEKTPGKGAALRAGYKAATGDILMVIDADGSNDPREISRYVRALLEGADFVKGSRFAHNGGTTDMPRYRKFGNAVFVHMVNLLFDTGFTDLCYGYHAFWRYCLDLIDLENVDGFECDTTLYLRAVRERLRISEVPSFEGYRFYGEGKLKTIPDGWRVLTTIVREWVEHQQAMRKADYCGFRGTAQATSLLQPNENLGVTLSGFSQAQTNQQLMQILLRMLSTEANLRGVLQSALRLTVDSMGASSASLVVVNESGAVTEGCLMQEGEAQTLQPTQLNDVLEQGLAGWVLKNGQPVIVDSTRDDPRWLLRSWEEDNEVDRSALGVPLMVSERVVGVLTLVRPEPQQFAEADLELVAKHAVGV
jgi:hypothetical protein